MTDEFQMRCNFPGQPIHIISAATCFACKPKKTITSVRKLYQKGDPYFSDDGEGNLRHITVEKKTGVAKSIGIIEFKKLTNKNKKP